jgi:HAD superfamily phosphatase (TIGR01668 family)
MFEMFFPDLIVDKIQDIELERLIERGVKNLILDIDNTLVPNHVKVADDSTVDWIEKVREYGFEVCIVSNATKRRVVKFNEKLKLDAVYRALKPGSWAFKKAMRIMNAKPMETAVVGDQIFTDIYGGKRLNLFTILVKPIHKNEALFVKLKRYPEKLVLDRYHRRKT